MKSYLRDCFYFWRYVWRLPAREKARLLRERIASTLMRWSFRIGGQAVFDRNAESYRHTPRPNAEADARQDRLLTEIAKQQRGAPRLEIRLARAHEHAAKALRRKLK